ncbi:MAG: phage tail assembly chaperone [Pannonibacter sp.]
MSGARPGSAEPFPWDLALFLAMNRLGWSPAMTWAATPRELALALGLTRRAAALSRRDLARLMTDFPDEGAP